MGNGGAQAYVLQAEKRLTLDERVAADVKGGQLPVPVTGLIPTVDWLREFTPPQLLDPDVVKRVGIGISPEEVARWGLRTGDLVKFGADRKVIEVSGITDDLRSRTRPRIEGVGGVFGDYADKMVPVDEHGILSIRMATLLAPIGYGQRLGILSPPNGGKTWLLRDLLQALLLVSKSDSRMRILVVQVGERAEDGTNYDTVINSVDHNPDQVELYVTPDGDPEFAHYYVVKFVTQRARELTALGYNVFLLVDSFSRVLMSHSRAEEIVKPPNVGMISGGISTASVTAVKKLLSIAGNFPFGSLTVVATMLTGQGSSEAALAMEVGPSVLTTHWELLNHPMSVKPTFNVATCGTREITRLLAAVPGFAGERELVKKLMWPKGRQPEEEDSEPEGDDKEKPKRRKRNDSAAQALEILRTYADNNKRPKR